MTAPPRQTMLATAPVSKLIWTFAIPAILSQVVNSDRKSTRLNSSHSAKSRMPSSA